MPLFRVVTLVIAKTFSKLFGLATITFFGRAPSRDDDKLGAVGIVSLSWLVTPVAVFVPESAELLIPFAPDDEALLRVIAVGGLLGLPPVVGGIISRVGNQPSGPGAVARNVLAGYAYTPAIGVLVVLLVVIVPLVKIGEIVRRRELSHLAVMVPEGGFDRFRAHAGELLEAAGCTVEDSSHPAVIRWLFAGLVVVESRIFRRGMDPRMDRLLVRADGDDDAVEVTLHATDISVIGRQQPACRVWAVLAEGLDPRIVYCSWDDESQAVEDDIGGCLDALDEGDPCTPEQLDELEERMRNLALSPPEWNAVRRQLYRITIASERLRAPSEA